MLGTVVIEGETYRPELACARNRCYSNKGATCSRRWAKDNAPTRTVPMFDECLLEGKVVGILGPHSPDIICGDSGHVAKAAWRLSMYVFDYLPTGAIPMLNRRAHSPDIVCRNGRYRVKEVV